VSRLQAHLGSTHTRAGAHGTDLALLGRDQGRVLARLGMRDEGDDDDAPRAS
jgi:hypothetical protein